ncbi:hypothetical protein XENTR_v10014108 [Xenopus tropicalis]|nr:hypothetical protein XENTR_v10014108 [Xenopus tropicalis]
MEKAVWSGMQCVCVCAIIHPPAIVETADLWLPAKCVDSRSRPRTGGPSMNAIIVIADSRPVSPPLYVLIGLADPRPVVTAPCTGQIKQIK